jgi:hypothetical protein
MGLALLNKVLNNIEIKKLRIDDSSIPLIAFS